MLSGCLALSIQQRSRPDILDVPSENVVAGTDSRTDHIIRSTSEAELIDPKGRFEESRDFSENGCCQAKVWVTCRHSGDG